MLLLGKPVAESLRQEQAARIKASGITPHLAIIQAGNNLASSSYIKMKQHYGESIGAKVDHHVCAGEAATLRALIERCNQDKAIHGLMIQMPIPNAADADTLVALIDPAKDVDGLSPQGNFHSATAMAIIKLLDYYKIELKDAPVALVGYGRLVGRPLAAILKDRRANVTICDVTTTPADLRAATRQAQVVISATGVGGLIKPGMLSDGTIFIDVGTSEDAGSIVGDADPELFKNETLKITPAKGGIGPITVATLFEQLLAAAGI